MKLGKLPHTRGYTMIELMVTLTIFAIITLFAVPAFYTFIEKSRAKAQISQAATFLRSAQEIAIANNRTVYVFTDGFMNYQTDSLETRTDYWTQDWIMAFKPMGLTNITMNTQIEELITDNERGYLISRQRIFTKSKKYVLSIIDSSNHNNILMQNLNNDQVVVANGEMEGYSKVRNANFQGLVTGAPTFIAFYPSGEVSLPIFIISERVTAKESGATLEKPFTYDYTFNAAPALNVMSNQWTTDVQKNFQSPIAILGGCRTGRSLTVDAINYTFNPDVMAGPYIFDGQSNNLSNAFAPLSISSEINYAPPPSFGHYLCGSRLLR